MAQLHRLNVKVTLQSWDLPFNSCPLHISWTLWANFIKLHPSVLLSEMMCRTYDSATHSRSRLHFKVMGVTLHISSTLWIIFIKLYPNVPLSEVVCRTNGSATQTQGQGHTSRSWDLPLNFMSFKSPQPFVRFSLNITHMFLSVSWCAEPMTQTANSKSRSHFKIMGFCGRGYRCPSDCCLV